MAKVENLERWFLRGHRNQCISKNKLHLCLCLLHCHNLNFELFELFKLPSSSVSTTPVLVTISRGVNQVLKKITMKVDNLVKLSA